MRVKDTASVSFDIPQLREIDKFPLTRILGRSGLIRLAVSEFLEKRKSESKKVEQNEKGEK